MYKSLLVLGAMFGLAAAVSGANAIQFGVVPRDGSELTVRSADHDCMRDEKGWHYMEKDRRHSCRPRRPEGKDWGWRCEGKRCGWWHAKEKRWND
jgi:hypothetical protein